MLDKAFSIIYDPFMAGVEAAGLSNWRAKLLAHATGNVLEIGAGTGLNLRHYPDVQMIVLLEPLEPMRERLRTRSGDHSIVAGVAEDLPFRNATFDTVVSGLVLCSVSDLERSLAEILRVLKPGGRFLFIEHVVDSRGAVRGLQRALEPIWKIAARGCHLTRDTEAAILKAGFTMEEIDRSGLPGGFLVVKAAIHGVARRP